MLNCTAKITQYPLNEKTIYTNTIITLQVNRHVILQTEKKN